MLALRLVRGGRPLTLLRRLLVAGATAVVGFLLLAALSHALAHPQQSGGSMFRLLWCVVPLAAAVQFAASVARTEPGSRSRSALDAAGVGPARIPMLAALSTALSCLLGSAVALLVYLHLRGQLATLPFDGAAVNLLAADRPLPVPAMLVLLSVLPLFAAGAAALATRPYALLAASGAWSGGTVGGGAGGARGESDVHAASRRLDRAGGEPDAMSFRALSGALPATATLPWGTALIAAGLALETYASRSPKPLSLSGVLSSSAPGVMGGWLLAAFGLVLAGPGLTQLCGQLLAAGRPGAVRLLSGRGLQQEAGRIGRPLGVLCAVAAGGLAAAELYSRAPEEGARALTPLTVLGAAMVVFCVTASALTAAAGSRAARAPAREALTRLGAPRRLLRGTAALRVVVLLVVLGSLTWAVGELAVLPLTS